MKIHIALLALFVMTTGCMENLPEAAKGEGDGGNGKLCGSGVYQSTIAIQYSAGAIPAKLSASVNGMPVVNECTSGTDNSSYLTVRTANAVTVLLRVDGNPAMNEMFFNPDGTPNSTRLQFIMKGRANCTDTPAQVYATTQTLNWKPVYNNADKSCATGYSATVSN